MNRSRRTKKTILTGWIMTAAAMLGVGALLAAPALVEVPAKLDPVTLCPVDRPLTSHVAVLVDRTDPFDVAQQSRFRDAFAELKAGLPLGGKLSVHLLSSDPAEAARPVIELCNPGDGSLVDPLMGNPRKVQSRFEEMFSAPIEAVVASLMEGAVADRSPILEAVAYTAAALDPGTPGRVVIVSDLLQNSTAQSHYQSEPDAAAILRTPEGAMLMDGRLSGVVVDLILLQSPHQQKRQGEKLHTFWRELLVSAGARPTIRSF